MKLTTLLLPLLAFASTVRSATDGRKCVKILWGAGTCNKPLADGGNGPKLTPAVIDTLKACFKNHYRPGPYTLDGNPQPDHSGVGKEWVVKTHIDGNPFSLSIGNLCGCKQEIDFNIFEDVRHKTKKGDYLSITKRCGVNSLHHCPAAENGSGFAPSGVYASAYSCPDDPCDTGGAQKVHVC